MSDREKQVLAVIAQGKTSSRDRQTVRHQPENRRGAHAIYYEEAPRRQ